MIQGLGFIVQGLGFRVQVQGLGLRVQGLGFRVQGLGFRVRSSGPQHTQKKQKTKNYGGGTLAFFFSGSKWSLISCTLPTCGDIQNFQHGGLLRVNVDFNISFNLNIGLAAKCNDSRQLCFVIFDWLNGNRGRAKLCIFARKRATISDFINLSPVEKAVT